MGKSVRNSKGRRKRLRLSCPTPFKTRYWSRVSAERALAELKAKRRSEKRVYYCSGKHWHTTSKSLGWG